MHTWFKDNLAAMSKSLLCLSSLLMAEKSAELLKIGLAHLLMMVPAMTLLARVSFGWRYRYMTAFPMPDSFRRE